MSARLDAEPRERVLRLLPFALPREEPLRLERVLPFSRAEAVLRRVLRADPDLLREPALLDLRELLRELLFELRAEPLVLRELLRPSELLCACLRVAMIPLLR